MTVPEDLPRRVLQVYKACLDSGEVEYFPSEVTRETNTIEAEIRLCESLSDKPGPPKKEGEDGKPESEMSDEEKLAKWKDEDVFKYSNWEEDQCLVAQFDGEKSEQFGILLNKFAVVPYHFLLVTKEWELQTSPISGPQFLAARQILDLWARTKPSEESAGGRLLCFFNCGDASGASQKHKHIQFAPMEGKGALGVFPTEEAAEAYTGDTATVFQLQNTGYAHHVQRLKDVPADAEKAMAYFEEVYSNLLGAAKRNLEALGEEAEEFSYNMLMTKHHMHLIPRSQKGFKLPEAELAPHERDEADPEEQEEKPDGKVVTEPAVIGCNAIAYTGAVLVKSRVDQERLVKVGGVIRALQQCGFPIAKEGQQKLHQNGYSTP